MENPNRAEAERLLGIAGRLLQNRDLTSSKDFAILAQETEPLLDGSDQILAVADVLISSEKRINNHYDWYSILQIDGRSDDQELIKKQYRKLALLLHPDKNKFPYADQAFKLVADSWVVLSNPAKKSPYDNELSLFTRVDLSSQQNKLPVRRSNRPADGRNQQNNVEDESGEDPRMRLSSFWTACPYCYLLCEYPRVYEGCCLRCQNCKRAFEAVVISSLPPMVPGQEAYYCCWGLFPMGFVTGGSGSGRGKVPEGFPNWMPPIFGGSVPVQVDGTNGAPVEERQPVPEPVAVPIEVVTDGIRPRSAQLGQNGKKRGRPRKVPVQV